MKKILNKKEYNTDTAVLVKKFAYGELGDTTGYEETLYQTEDGFYFLYVNGGEDSPYKTENIKSISKVRATEWLENH